MYGEYRITGDDLIRNRIFDDPVAYCAFPIDIHNPEGTDVQSTMYEGRFGVPWRALYSSKVANLVMAGRAISADHIATGALRSTVTCMATGQAAGVAAALMAGSGKANVDVRAEEILSLVDELPESLE